MTRFLERAGWEGASVAVVAGSTATMEAVSDDATPDEASREVELHAEDDGVHVAVEEDGTAGGVVVIPWSQAVAVARRIIELARARGDLT